MLDECDSCDCASIGHGVTISAPSVEQRTMPHSRHDIAAQRGEFYTPLRRVGALFPGRVIQWLLPAIEFSSAPAKQLAMARGVVAVGSLQVCQRRLRQNFFDSGACGLRGTEARSRR